MAFSSLKKAAPAISVREALRQGTATLHQAVEREIGLNQSGLTRKQYQHILGEFYRIYLPLEQALEAVLHRDLPSYYPGRRRTPHLESDLAHLKINCARLPRRQDLPSFPDLPAALGSLYVIEGSTLGGQMISRDLSERLGVVPGKGGTFFAGYGARTGRRWKEFLELLERHISPEETHIAVGHAREMFACFLNADWERGA
jgi:heme oxygenase